ERHPLRSTSGRHASNHLHASAAHRRIVGGSSAGEGGRDPHRFPRGGLPVSSGSRLAGVTTVAPDGRRLLRIEARNAETPIERKPPWIKVKATMGPGFTDLRGLVQREGLHTVCQEAGCPNIYECWEDREATFLI